MNLKCHVLAVETDGVSLKVRMQGSGVTDAEWRPMMAQTISIPDTPRNQKAFYVGRIVKLAVNVS